MKGSAGLDHPKHQPNPPWSQAPAAPPRGGIGRGGRKCAEKGPRNLSDPLSGAIRGRAIFGVIFGHARSVHWGSRGQCGGVPSQRMRTLSMEGHYRVPSFYSKRSNQALRPAPLCRINTNSKHHCDHVEGGGGGERLIKMIGPSAHLGACRARGNPRRDG